MDGMQDGFASRRAARVPGRWLARHACAISLMTACGIVFAQGAPAGATDTGASAAAISAASASAADVPRMGAVGTDLILIGMAVVLFLAVLIVIKTLRVQNWSLAQALSEEASLPDGTPTPAAGQTPPMVASSSRLIALVGLIVLGTFFTGIGFYLVWALCSGHRLDRANDAWTFFASGSALFLPYGVNKFASVLK